MLVNVGGWGWGGGRAGGRAGGRGSHCQWLRVLQCLICGSVMPASVRAGGRVR